MKNCDAVKKSSALTNINKRNTLLFGVPFCSNDSYIDVINNIARDIMGVFVRVVKHQRVKYRRRNRPPILKVSQASEEQANMLVCLSPTFSSSSDYVLRCVGITHDLMSSSMQSPIVNHVRIW